MIQATIRVDVGRVLAHLDRNLYGHFTEHMGRCVYGGLWAEMLDNRKFNGPDLYEYGVVSPWQSVGRGAGVRYSHDNTIYYAGRQSQRVMVQLDDGQLHGVAQGPLVLQAGRRYHLRLVARQVGLSGPLRLALESQEGRLYVSHEWRCPEGDWQGCELTLTAPADDPLARLSITFAGMGTLWLGAASLMPADTIFGWRADVVEAARGLRPALLRWPGGNFASAYHWQDGIGPRDRRPVRLDPAWEAWEPNDVGTDEFIQLCRELQAEPYLCVNLGSGTAEEAAAWVEYCNGPADSPNGSLRAANGHPEPYGVRYWGVGNETYGNWQHGHVDAETYARRYVEFAQAMRAVDPGLVLVGVGAQDYEAPGWTDAVLEIAGERMDYLSLHHYTPGYGPGELPLDHKPDHDALYPIVVAGPERVAELLQDAGAALARHGLGGKVHVALDEWNTWVYPHYEPGVAEPYLLRDGLYAAGMFNVFHRHGDLVKMGSLAQMVNVLGAIYTTQAGLFTTPVYLANKLYVEHSGSESVETRVESPTFAVPAEAFLPARAQAPYIDAQATLTEDRRRLYLAVINRHRYEDIAAQIDVAGAKVLPQGRGHELNGPSALSGNSITNPDVVRVQPVPGFAAANRFIYTFPAHSVTVLELDLAAAQG